MKKKKRIFILIIAVLIIIGSGVYLGTYYHAVDIVQKWTQPPTHIPNSFSNMKMGNINQESH